MSDRSRARIDLGFQPRRWQAEFFAGWIAAGVRFAIAVVHRQAGKTELALAKLLDAALRSVRSDARFGYVAPLQKQARGIVWDRLKAKARKLPGTIVNESELSVTFANGARIRLFGADSPDSLRGHVFDGLVLDEVAQMALRLWGEVLLPTLADRNGWALFIGTPKGVNLFSTLYFKALTDPAWFAALYDCFQTRALSAEAIAQIRRESTDAQFRQEMECDFGATSDNVLISLDVARAASQRKLRPAQYEFAPKILGVDVAWQGGDRSCIVARQGLQMWRPVVLQGIPEKTFAARIAGVIERWRPDATFCDTTGGYGGEVVSRLSDLGYFVEGVIFSSKASSDRFANLRSEMYWKIARWLEEGASIPPMPELLAELCAPTVSNDNAANRLTIESKDAIRARIGVSPDISDSLAVTFSYPVVKAADRAQPGHALCEFDPYEAVRR